MSLSQIINFGTANEANFTKKDASLFDWSLADRTKLALIDLIGQNFSQDYSSSTGFVFSDATRSEVNGGKIQQKDAIYSNEQFGASAFNGSAADRAIGTKTATANAGATLSTFTPVNPGATAHQYYDVSGGVANKYWSFPTNNLANMTLVGTVSFKFVAKYSGVPAVNRYFTQQGLNLPNLMSIFHQATGNLSIRINNSTGAAGAILNTAGVNFTLNQEYDFEFGYNITLGDYYLFIDGVPINSWIGIAFAGARTTNVDPLLIGGDAGNSSNYLIRDYQMFNTVQHTADFSASIPRTIYNFLESNIAYPLITYPGSGSIQEFTNFLNTIEVGTGRFTVNGLYYNAGWVATSNTYATASSAATILANIATLPASDTVQLKLFFDNTFTKNEISQTDIGYTGQEYSDSNPWLLNNSGVDIDGLYDFIETIGTITGNDALRYALRLSGVDYWFDGTNWSIRPDINDYATTNSGAEILANKSSLPVDEINGKKILVRFFLHSDDKSTTPEIIKLQLDYNFFDPSECPNKCKVYFTAGDFGCTPSEGITVTFYVEPDEIFGHGSAMPLISAVESTDDLGKGEIDIVETATISKTVRCLVQYFDRGELREALFDGITIPDQGTVDLPTLLGIN